MKRSSRNRKRERRGHRRALKLRGARRLQFESLEDRRLLATVTLESGLLSFSTDVAQDNGVEVLIENVGGQDHLRVIDHHSPLTAGTGVTAVDANTIQAPLSSVTSVSLSTGDDDDEITLHSNLPIPVTIAAGAGLDSLKIEGGAGPDEWTLGDGEISTGLAVIDFAGLESVELSPGAGDDSMVVQEGFAALGLDLQVSGKAEYDDQLSLQIASASPAIVTADATQVTLDNAPGAVSDFALTHNGLSQITISASSGADEISITPATQTAFIVEAGAPSTTPGDLIRVNGAASLDWTGLGAGVLQADGKAAVSFTGIETALSNRLEVSLNQTSIPENAGAGVIEATITRTDAESDYDDDLILDLSYLDDSELFGPNNAIIPAGQRSLAVLLTAVDDNLLDGSQDTAFVVSSSGYASIRSEVTIEDHELLTLSLDKTSVAENAGAEAVVAELRRGDIDDLSSDVVVSLTHDLAGEISLPETITIPAGSSSKSFFVDAVDDDLLDGAQFGELTASAAGFVDGQAPLEVSDHEVLQIELSVSEIGENAGAGSVQATITRSNTDREQALEFTLNSDDHSEATTPITGTILANQASVTLPIDVLDDNLLDGAQTVTLTSSASGYTESSSELIVNDHETLVVTLDNTQIREDGGQLGGVVTRSNLDDPGPYTVALASDGEFVTVPANVAFASGETTAHFTLDVEDNSLLQGTRTAIITASAEGFETGQQSLDVLDHETLTVSLETTTMSENGGSITATVTRNDVGAETGVEIEVNISDDSEASAPASVVIPAGHSSASFTIEGVDDTLLDGEQTLMVTVDSSGFYGSHADFTVIDSEPLTLSFSTDTVSENDGPTAVLATLSRPSGQDDSTLVAALVSSNSNIARAPNNVSIPVGQDSIQFYIAAVSNQLLTGSQQVEITAFSSGYEPDTATLTVEDHETIEVSIDRDYVLEEDVGEAAQITVTRSNVNNSAALVVDLSADLSGEIIIPSQVTIPAGLPSVTVGLETVDDNVIEEPSLVTVTAQAEGYHSISDSVEVIDVEMLHVTSSRYVVGEDAGQDAFELTITRFNDNIENDLVVGLTSSDTSEIRTPASAIIPAGVREITVSIDVVDDPFLDGQQDVRLEVGAFGFVTNGVTIEVTDHETLGLQIADDSIHEHDGVGATTGVVSRSNADISQALTVALINSDATEVTIPKTVEIPAGAQSTSFSIDAINDFKIDGTQKVTLTALAEGYQQDEGSVDVHDYEGEQSWVNPDHPYDIDANRFINVRDALILVFELRTRGPMSLPAPTPTFGPAPWLDANGDGQFNALDPFSVISFLNENGPMPIDNAPDAEGEQDGRRNGGANQPRETNAPASVGGTSAGSGFGFEDTIATAAASSSTSRAPNAILAPIVVQPEPLETVSSRRGDVQYGAARYASQHARALPMTNPVGAESGDPFADLSAQDRIGMELDDILEDVADDVDRALHSRRR